MKKVTLALCAIAVAAATGCKPREGAIRATITLQAQQKASCVFLEVRDPAGTLLDERKLERTAGDSLVVGIYQGGYPDQIVLRAAPRYGVACADPLYANGAGVEQAVTFPVGSITEVTLALAGPTAAEDGDADGFTDTAEGGPDCDDGNDAAHPEAAESCTAGTDLNCNQRVGCADPACAAVPCAEPPASLAFTSAAQDVVAGACSGQLTVQARDAANAAQVVAVATAVALSAPAGAGVSFFSDAACASPISTLTLATGESAAGFYFRTTVAGAPTLTATTPGATPGAQTQSVRASSPAAIIFGSASQSVDSGSCSAPVSLRMEDGFGNASSVVAPVIAALTASPSTGFKFYSNATCSAEITSATFATGTSSTEFYFRGTSLNTITLSASASGFPAATQSAVVRAGPPTVLAFATPAQILTAGLCSTEIALETRDSTGNPVPATASTAVTLGGPAGVSLFSNAACTTPLSAPLVIAQGAGAGASSARLFLKATTPGPTTVTAAATGFTTASQTHTVVTGGPTSLRFTSAAKVLTAGSCSGAVTFRTEDGLGNAATVSAATPISFGPVSGGPAFYTTTNCSGAAQTGTSLASGSGTGTFSFRATVAGTLPLTISSPSLNADTQDQTINPAAPVGIAFSTTAQTVTAGACSTAVGVRVVDGFGNTTNATADFALGLSSNAPAGSLQFFADAACATTAVTSVTFAGGTSSRDFYFRPTRSGGPTLTVTSPANTLTQGVTVTPAAASKIVFLTTPQTVAAGACSPPLGAQIQDAFGNPSPVTADTVISLSSDAPATLRFHPATGCAAGSETTQLTVSAGSSAVPSIYLRDTRVGTPQLTLDATGLTPATQTQTIIAAAASKLVLLTPPRTATAGTCVALPLTVQVQDGFDNPVVGARTLNLTDSLSPAAALTFHATSACGGAGVATIAVAAGSSTADVYFKATTAGPVDVTVDQLPTLAAVAQTQTIVAGAPTLLVFTSAPQTVPAQQCSSPVTLQTRDAGGNVSPVATAVTVTLSDDGGAAFSTYSDAGCATPAGSVQIAAGSSSATFYFKGTTPDPGVVITAAATSFNTPTQTEVVGPTAPTQLKITSPARTLIASAACSAAVTVALQDAGGGGTTSASATQIDLAATPGAGFAFFTGATCAGSPVTSVSLPANTASVSFYFKSTVADSYLVTVSNPNLAGDSQTETVSPATPNTLAFTSAPQTVTAGTCSSVVTIRARDSFGNAAAVATTTALALVASPDGSAGADFRFFSDAGCTAEITSVNVPATTSTAQPFYFIGRRAGPVDVSASGTGFPAATQQQTLQADAVTALRFVATTGQVVGPSSCSQAVDVEAVDAFGNRVAVSRTVSLSANPSAGFTFHATAGCGAAAVTTAPMTAGLATFYFKGTAAGTVDVTVTSSPLTAATQSQTVGRMVQSGVCTLANGASTQTCNFGSALGALNKSVLFYQAVNIDSPGNADSAVICRLASTAGVTCARSGSAGQVDVTYYVVEFATGVSVQRSGELSCANGSVTLDWDSASTPAFAPVDVTKSFVLLNTRRGGGNNSGSVFSTAKLSSTGDAVTFDNVGGCGQGQLYEAQVVTFNGAGVNRGTVTMTATNSSVAVLTSNVDRTRSFLLFSVRPVDTSNANTLCERMVRGRLSANNGITFSRADGAAAATCATVDLTIEWERIQLPAGNVVQEVNIDPGGATVGVQSLGTAVDLSRAVAISGAHGTSGQAGGETSRSDADNIGEGRARFAFTNGGASLTALRGVSATTTPTALFTAYAIEFVSPP